MTIVALPRATTLARLVLLTGAANAACEGDGTPTSCGVPTERLSVVATLVDNGEDLRAEVDFAVGDRSSGEGWVALCDGDELTIAGAEPEHTDRGGRVVYSHTEPATANRAFAFELTREGEGAAAFTIALPPAFEITAPQPQGEIPRSADFVLQWEPPDPGGTMRIGLLEEIGGGVCLETLTAEHDYKNEAGVDVEDDGNWKIPAEVVDGGARDHCDAIYTFARFAAVEYPAQFATGGYLEGRAERRVAFVSVP